MRLYLTVDKCLNWIRKELFEESVFGVFGDIWLKLVMYSDSDQF